MPYFGYWDSYDNKFAPIIQEPYARLLVITAITYLVWYRTAIFLRSHFGWMDSALRRSVEKSQASSD